MFFLSSKQTNLLTKRLARGVTTRVSLVVTLLVPHLRDNSDMEKKVGHLFCVDILGDTVSKPLNNSKYRENSDETKETEWNGRKPSTGSIWGVF